MAEKIKVLSTLMASKIAAGEVVERPASVVKELLENALDAGARTISIEIAEGGKRLMRVVDDGSGMGVEDAEKAFLRHATSKISNDSDLDSIKTLGFRGEALSSIGAVSRVLLKTREQGDATGGVSVKVEGGVGPVITPAGCAEGTSVEVRDLFFNTPARLKFLRSIGSEFGRIMDIVKAAALVNPAKRFTLLHGSNKAVETTAGFGDNAMRQRIKDLFGKKTAESLIRVENSFVSGFIGTHELSYATTRGLHLYVNGRPVRDKSINHAVIDGYGTIIERGRFPFVVIDIKIPFEDVDVNIHPAKSEVRFKSPGAVHDLVRSTVKKALAAGTLPGFAAFGAKAVAGAPGAPYPVDTRGSGGSWSRHAPGYVSGVKEASTGFGPRDSGWEALTEEVPGLLDRAIAVDGDGEVKNPEFLNLEPVGQLFGEFLIAQSNGSDRAAGFYIIDQHGAEERSAFERLRKAYYGKAEIKRQLLLLPGRIETTPEERDSLYRVKERLERLGFEIAPFGPSAVLGGETFLVKSVPELLGAKNPVRLVKDLAEELGALEGSALVDHGIDRALMTIACHSVIRGPRALSKEEGSALLNKLALIDFAGHCPHGRPVVKRFSRRELELMFKR